MGVAQCEPGRERARLAYLFAFAAATRWPVLGVLASGWVAPNPPRRAEPSTV
jgi:hypothetical protein